ELERKPERLRDPSYIKALGDVIGSGNRLIFLEAGNPEPVIVNRHRGVEHNGCWYSNTYAWDRNHPYGGSFRSLYGHDWDLIDDSAQWASATVNLASESKGNNRYDDGFAFGDV